MSPNRMLLGALLLLAVFPTAWALRSDRNQPIDIKADRVEVDQRAQTSHYTGNVRLEQGSLKINADDVMVYMEKGRLQKIVINGKPARFEQQPDNQKEVVTSQADNMEYFAGEERLFLKHNAEVNQGGNHFRGEFIEYDTLTSTVKANKGENATSRVHAIIQPDTDKQDDKQATPEKPAAPVTKDINSQAPQKPAPGKP
jgi:lipopolysaccharide export system protein LptA